MKFTVDPKQQTFFSRKGYLELEPLFSEEELDAVAIEIDQALQQQLKTPQARLSDQETKELFLLGRDLWRHDTEVKKLVFNKQLAQITASLLPPTGLRIAYDQAIRIGKNPGKSPLPSPTTLQKVSAFQSIVCGILIRLTDGPAPKVSDFFCPYPAKKGEMTLFKPDLPLSFDPLFQIPNQSLLLIAYCIPKTVYILEPNDPHTHRLKKEGYAFGDLLKNKTHPIILR